MNGHLYTNEAMSSSKMPSQDSQPTHKVLVVEDSQDLAHLLELHLRDINCAIDLASDGTIGLSLALKNTYYLIILDLMLPGVDGLDICRQLRTRPQYTPILMLTARSTEVDRILGLEMGADDYLTKPFSIRELVARVKAMFRRVNALSTRSQSSIPEQVQVGDLVIDCERRTVSRSGHAVELTAKEFDLILHLARHPGRVYTRAQLLEDVWDYSYAGYEHTVNSTINRLRAKIEDQPAKPRYLLTVWGVGYKFFDPTEEA